MKTVARILLPVLALCALPSPGHANLHPADIRFVPLLLVVVPPPPACAVASAMARRQLLNPDCYGKVR